MNNALSPMSNAPRDGSPIVVKTREHGFNEYRRCVWVQHASTCGPDGGWRWEEYDCVGQLREHNAIGWMPEPCDPDSLDVREVKALEWFFSADASGLKISEARDFIHDNFGADVDKSLESKFGRKP